MTSPLRTEIHVVVRTVTADPAAPTDPSNAIGVDLGIKHRIVTSNGYAAAGVTVDRTEITKHQRALSRHDNKHRKNKTRRHTPGRARKVKTLAKAHARVRVSERHRLHRLVHEIFAMCDANGFDGIAVEKLNIANMVKNRCLADRIYQQRWGMFLRLLECKAARAGIKIVDVDPCHTSLECSSCTHRKPSTELPLTCRIYVCEQCGLVLDRDVYAGRNVLVRGFGERFRDAGGVTPAAWPANTLTRVPSCTEKEGETVESNLTDSTVQRMNSELCSGEALLETEQAKQYALDNPEI